jgi:hypothetical protein
MLSLSLASRPAAAPVSLATQNADEWLANMIRQADIAPIWAKMDGVYVFAAPDQGTALLNLKGPTFDLTINGSPAWTDLANVAPGFASGAASGHLVGPNLSTAGGQFTANSAHVGWYQWSAGAAASSVFGTNNLRGSLFVDGSNNAGWQYRVNQAATASGFHAAGVRAPYDGRGHGIVSRTANTAADFYHDGIRCGSTYTTAGAGSIDNTALAVAANAFIGQWPARSLGFFHYGAGMTETEVTLWAGLMHEYMQRLRGPLLFPTVRNLARNLNGNTAWLKGGRFTYEGRESAYDNQRTRDRFRFEVRDPSDQASFDTGKQVLRSELRQATLWPVSVNVAVNNGAKTVTLTLAGAAAEYPSLASPAAPRAGDIIMVTVVPTADAWNGILSGAGGSAPLQIDQTNAEKTRKVWHKVTGGDTLTTIAASLRTQLAAIPAYSGTTNAAGVITLGGSGAATATLAAYVGGTRIQSHFWFRCRHPAGSRASNSNFPDIFYQIHETPPGSPAGVVASPPFSLGLAGGNLIIGARTTSHFPTLYFAYERRYEVTGNFNDGQWHRFFVDYTNGCGVDTTVPASGPISHTQASIMGPNFDGTSFTADGAGLGAIKVYADWTPGAPVPVLDKTNIATGYPRQFPDYPKVGIYGPETSGSDNIIFEYDHLDIDTPLIRDLSGVLSTTPRRWLTA